MICRQHIKRNNQITKFASQDRQVHGRTILKPPDSKFVKKTTEILNRPFKLCNRDKNFYFWPMTLETTNKPQQQPKKTMVGNEKVQKRNILRLFINQVDSFCPYLDKKMGDVETAITDKLKKFGLEDTDYTLSSKMFTKVRKQTFMEVDSKKKIQMGSKIRVYVILHQHNHVLKVFQNLVQQRNKDFPWRIYMSTPKDQQLYVKNSFKSMLAHWLTNLEFDKVNIKHFETQSKKKTKKNHNNKKKATHKKHARPHN